MEEEIKGSRVENRPNVKYFCFVTDDESRKMWYSMNLQQKNALVFMADKMNMTGLVNMSGKNRYDMMSLLNIKSGRFYQLIRQLIKINAIRRYGGGDYLVNPALFFKGNSYSNRERIRAIYNHKNEWEENKD